MDPFQLLKSRLTGILDEFAEAGALPHGLDYGRVNVEPPREAEHGDVATNAAMVLAKPAEMKPRDLAEAIAGKFTGFDDVTAAEVAGPGFINLRLAPAFWQARIGDILGAGTAYGDSRLGAGRKVNVEYVSANPTGPLHVGHGRGAVVGDALAALLAKAGFEVTREYYVNDAGAQVEALARSLHFRYWEALGLQVGEMPEGVYPGDYLIPVAEKLAERDRSDWPVDPAKERVLGESILLEQFRGFAVDAMMEMIREDLEALGIVFDRFSSERALVEAGGVDKVLADLEDRDLVYTGTLDPPKGKEPDDWEPRPQLLFRASDFGDDVDRPLKKSDGSWTYFATDMAYHFDKHARGYRDMIDVWGADHGGYVKRMQAAVNALTAGDGNLDVKICQMVNLMEDGEPVKMSKRAGTFVTLRDVIDEVGKDAVRFIMLTRKNDAQLDFDLKKVLEQSRDNPVFYVQYSHARCHSVLRHAAEMFPDEDFSPAALMDADFSLLADDAELDLIKSMAEWPRVVEGAAEAHEPHRIAYYLLDVSGLFHALWTKGTREDASLRFLNEQDLGLTRARLALVRGLALVIASGLEVMGVTPVEEMR